MFEKDLIVFLDGKYLKLEDADVSVMTHSLHYGSAVFEGIRAYNTINGTAVFRLQEHIDRLFYSAEVIGAEIPFTKEELIEATLEVLRKNNLKSAYIRPLVFFDDTSLGLKVANSKVRVLIAAWDWGKYLSESVKVKISEFKRISEKSTIPDAKISGHYVNSILAGSQVQKKGFDEALLLDHNDAIAEGPGENIFFIKDKILYTPKKGKILTGITRSSVIEFAQKLGYEVQEVEIFTRDLENFEGAFFTGTAAEVTPISEITDLTGNVFKFNLNTVEEIKTKFFSIVEGKEEESDNWFTKI